MKKNRKRPLPAAAVPLAAAPAAPRGAVEWRRHLPILLVLWAAALLAYSNSFQAGFTYDNGVAIQQDPRIRSTSGALGPIFNEEYWYTNNNTGLYRPFTTLSFLFNYAVLGNAAKPAGYHWVNFALHAVNIALVYFLGLLLLGEVSWAAVLAALWALHPLLTESITNLVGRSDQLAAFGVLAGLLCHVFAGRAVGPRKLAWLGGLALAAAVAIFSKESGAALPAAMLCYDAAFRKSSPWRSRVAGYAAVALPFAVFFLLRARMLDHSAVSVTPFIDNPLVDASLVGGWLTALRIVGKYVWLFVWPARLSCDYSYNQISLFEGPFGWEGLAALLSAAACLAAAWLAYRTWRAGQSLACFAIAFFFVSLAPTANLLIPVGSIMAERWMYLPAFALALGVTMGLQALAGRFPGVPKRTWLAAAGVLCLAWGARAYVRNFDWRDDRALWESAERVSPNSYKAYSMLANLLATSAHPELDRAIRESERSTAILDRVSDENNLARAFAVEGMCYRLKGEAAADPAEKQAWYRKALPPLLRARRIDLAIRDRLNRVNQEHGKGSFQAGLALLYLELGRVQRRLKQYPEAVQSLAYGRQLQTLPDFSEEESMLYRDQGDPDRPAVALLEGLFMDPRSQRLANRVVQFYKQYAPLTCAIQRNGTGSAFDPQCPLVHSHICEAAHIVYARYREFGTMDKATATAQTAISGYGCPSSLFQ